MGQTDLCHKLDGKKPSFSCGSIVFLCAASIIARASESKGEWVSGSSTLIVEKKVLLSIDAVLIASCD